MKKLPFPRLSFLGKARGAQTPAMAFLRRLPLYLILTAFALLYLEPVYRGKGCSVQLLARAYSFFKAEGRNALRLHVAEDNETALAFYLREGFRQIGSEGGGHGKLLLMEKKLGVRDDA